MLSHQCRELVSVETVFFGELVGGSFDELELVDGDVEGGEDCREEEAVVGCPMGDER